MCLSGLDDHIELLTEFLRFPVACYKHGTPNGVAAISFVTHR